MVFRYKTGRSVIGIPAQIVGEELARIEATGQLTPAAVVEVSKPNDAPLHPAFEWDDPSAAHEYRLHQARQIVNCVLIVPESNEKKPVQAFVSVSVSEAEDTQPDRKYVSAVHVVEDKELRQQHLSMLRRKLRKLRDELAAFEEFGPVVQAIDRSL